MNVLITTGATREPIDAVRFISNVSTGATGMRIARHLLAAGHAVTLLHGEGVEIGEIDAGALVFGTTQNLQERLRALLGTGDFGAVIHCAAIADYRPEMVSAGKLSSDVSERILRLVPTPKLLPELKAYAPPGSAPIVVGFKFTVGVDEAERARAVAKIFSSGTVDYVVQNDAGEREASGLQRPFRVYAHEGEAMENVHGIEALSEWLDRRLAKTR